MVATVGEGTAAAEGASAGSAAALASSFLSDVGSGFVQDSVLGSSLASGAASGSGLALVSSGEGEASGRVSDVELPVSGAASAGSLSRV